jgi:hypothetical protein
MGGGNGCDEMVAGSERSDPSCVASELEVDGDGWVDKGAAGHPVVAESAGVVGVATGMLDEKAAG